MRAHDFLTLKTKPAISGIREASWILGMPEDWIAILVAGGVLRPGRGHKPGCKFYFSTVKLLQLAKDPDWIERAITTVRKSVAKKNAGGSHA